MVVAITEGVGAHIGRSVRSSFYKLADRLPSVTNFSKLDFSMQQQIIDILALSIFYNEVVQPLESGRAFFSLASRSNATHIRIGADKLTSRFAGRSLYCVSSFYAILQQHDINTEMLSFSTLQEFVTKITAAAILRMEEQ